jgi:hypothetical protein
MNQKKLRTYKVCVREVWVQEVEVKALTPENALKKVIEGEGEYIEDALEYSHSLEPETWTVHTD